MKWLFIAVSFFVVVDFLFAAAVSLFLLQGRIHREGSSPSHAADRHPGGFFHHHEMLLDNLWSLYTTVRMAPQAAGFCRSWRFDFLAQNYEPLQSNNCLLGCERVMETRAEFHFNWVYTFSATLSSLRNWANNDTGCDPALPRNCVDHPADCNLFKTTTLLNSH